MNCIHDVTKEKAHIIVNDKDFNNKLINSIMAKKFEEFVR
jgi:hypothetical protein